MKTNRRYHHDKRRENQILVIAVILSFIIPLIAIALSQGI